MKLSTVQKYLSAFILLSFYCSNYLIASVYADDDPNKSVSDYWNTDKDVKQMKEETENETKNQLLTDSTEGRSSWFIGWDYIKTIFALLFVVGLLFGLLKLVNRKNRLYDKNRFHEKYGWYFTRSA